MSKASRIRPIGALALFLTAVLLGACRNAVYSDQDHPQRPPELPVNRDAIADVEPRNEPLSPQGNGPALWIEGKRYQVLEHAGDYLERGRAGWYATRDHGQSTVNGDIHDMYRMTAAHNTLPIPSYAKVTHLGSNRSVIVRINDRAPMEDGQIIRLSLAAVAKLHLGDFENRFVEVRGIQTRPRERSTRSTPTPPRNLPTSSPQTPTAGAGVYVQAGAFHLRGNARKLLDRLQALRIRHVFMDEAILPIGAVYRVRIGPFKDRNEARQAVRTLRAKGIAAHVAP